MSPEPLRQPWDLAPVFDLLHALSPSPDKDHEITIRNPQDEIATNNSRKLGDFSLVWTYLGQSVDIPSPEGNRVSLESSLSDEYSTVSSSSPDEIQLSDFYSKAKEVRWKDEVDETKLTKAKSARKNHNTTVSGDLDKAVLAKLFDDESTDYDQIGSKRRSMSRPARQSNQAYASEFESEFERQTRRKPPRLRRNGLHASTALATTPENISTLDRQIIQADASTPRPKATNPVLWSPAVPEIKLDPTIIQPLYLLTANEKKVRLAKKLLAKFGAEPNSLLSTDRIRAVSNWGGNTSKEGIHVFVDCSNIIIGFYNALKTVRGLNINAYIKQPPISYHSLALILERGRAVARRILAGSGSASRPGSRREASLPTYIAEARQCDYELNILERVLKHKDPTPTKKRRPGIGNGYATSGQSSGSEAPFPNSKVMTEQCVDEILHLKILETLVDYQKEPKTIVVASGDAAEAEYSGGFLKNVERALANGWKVELVAWRDGLSRDYRAPEFQKKWEGQFMIIELDDFSEELLAVYKS